MAINPVQQGKSGIGNLMSLGETVAGAVTGNPELIMAGVGGLASSSPMGKAANIGSDASKLNRDFSSSPTKLDSLEPAPDFTPNQDFLMPDSGGYGKSAISRAVNRYTLGS